MTKSRNNIVLLGISGPIFDKKEIKNSIKMLKGTGMEHNERNKGKGRNRRKDPLNPDCKVLSRGG